MATQKSKTPREILREYIPGYPDHNKPWSPPDPRETVDRLVTEFKEEVEKILAQPGKAPSRKK